MYYNYGIHKTQWKTIKSEVIKDNINSKDIAEMYELDSRQIWYLYDVLLQGKYNKLYKREPIDEVKIGDYVHSNDYGRGEVISIYDNFIRVKFIDKDIPILFNLDGSPCVDTCKITKL